MTDFYKVVIDGFVDGFGTNGNDSVTEITEAEYDELRSMFRSMPTAPDGYAYLLRDNPREWVLIEVPIEDEDIDDVEAFEMLFGGAV